MKTVDIESYARRRDELRELKKENETLRNANSELDQKVKDIYGAYETLQYTFSGRYRICSEEIRRLRDIVETLKKELHDRGWEGD